MIDRDAFDAYDRALSTNADLVAEAVRALAKVLDGLAGDELVAALDAEYPRLVTSYGTVASAAAVEFYARQREASGVSEPYEAAQFYPRDWGLLRFDVASEAARGRELGAVLDALAGRSQQRVMAYADETIGRNSQLDPAHPLWAIVPHTGACAWCVTLGSFGFTYGSRGIAAAARHPSCRCTPACDFDRDSPSLAGYSPEEMYDSYRMCQDAVRDDAERRWRAMSDEERSRYTSAGHAHKDGTRGARRVDYQAYLKRRTVEEMDRRDRGWLQGGEDPKVTRERGARPWRKERAVARVLSANGYEVAFVREPKDRKVYDARLCGVPYEFKVPEEFNPEKTIKNQFKKAVGKGTDKLVISNCANHASNDEMCSAIEAFMKAGGFPEISEVLYAGEDGLVRRFTR